MNIRSGITKPNRQLQAKYDRIYEIVAANPDCGVAHISKQYYEIDRPTSQQRSLTISLLTQLCHDKRVEYQPIDRYTITN